MRVFITRNIPDIGPAKLRATGWEIDQWHSDEVIPRATLLEKVKGADAILSLLTERIDGELLEAAGPQLKVVANLAVGFDNFVVGEMTQRHDRGSRMGAFDVNRPNASSGAEIRARWQVDHLGASLVPGTGHPSRDARANRRRQNWCSDGPQGLGV